MIVTRNELIVPFDVDKTLIFPKKIEDVENPENLLQFDYAGEVRYMIPHYAHVSLLKHYKKRGYYVIVWSANGYAWAEQAVKKLGIEEYVDEVKTKPVKHVDDMDCEKWMGPRVYIPEGEEV